jgi:hypothetical protein
MDGVESLSLDEIRLSGNGVKIRTLNISKRTVRASQLWAPDTSGTGSIPRRVRNASSQTGRTEAEASFTDWGCCSLTMNKEITHWRKTETVRALVTGD